MPTAFRSVVLGLLPLTMAGGGPSFAQALWEETHLLDASVGSQRSLAARGLGRGGYELADGQPVWFRDWYRPAFPEVTVLMLTQVTADFGLIWGASTGESAAKYRIDPALHLGFVYRHEPFDGAEWFIKATYPLFGRLRERTCTADYGEIGGVQRVNCRLAADLMPPEETLDFLVDLPGAADARISIGFQLWF